MTEQVPAYRIGPIVDVQVRDERGMLIPGKQITVYMANGQHFFVEVPYGEGWSEAALPLIEAQHAEHQQVMEHQGPMVPAPRRSAPFNPRIGQ